jgi:hypothetical protein
MRKNRKEEEGQSARPACKKNKFACESRKQKSAASEAARALCSDERIQKDNEARARKEGKGRGASVKIGKLLYSIP